jgi:16S rRNA (adenine1518-N6/adenine1519-N6)-dimethyltransferase
MQTGRQAKKSLGQHWLFSQISLDDIVEDAKLEKEDHILEIGPGTGNLTVRMSPKVKQITAVEIDDSLINELNALKLPNFNLVHQDILKYNLNDMEPGYKIVANIPYYLTSKLIRVLSETKNKPSLVVLLVQKEIAERLSADVGDYSILGLTAQYFWEVEKMQLVPSDRFDPRPKVDSQIVRMTPKDSQNLTKEDEKELFRLIRIGFASKRKTLVNNLKNGYQLSREDAEDYLGELDLHLLIRPQELSLTNWIDLLKIINRK